MKIITLILLSIISSATFSGEPEDLKRYREKMAYWQERWESAFKCDNRYKVAMFLYDSTLEKGAHPSEVLSEKIERISLENPDCIKKSLVVLPPNKVEAIIKKYYEAPIFNEPSAFYELTSKLRFNRAPQPTAESGG